jgi:ATP-dependent DNA helicase RecQ
LNAASYPQGIPNELLTGPLAQRAKGLLAEMVGPDAEFHDHQLEAIMAVAVQRRRLLLVERTGWGKSVVYFIATRLLRDAGLGPTIVISPLLALMRNQLALAERAGLVARTVNSQNPDEHNHIELELKEDRCDLLLVSPERLANRAFVAETLLSLPKGLGMFVVDEAHCISDWGHDFRLDYRRIVNIVRSLPDSVPVLATTATANDRVVQDTQSQLGGIDVIRGPLARESLLLQNIRLDDQAQRLAWLAEHIPGFAGSGVIYCLTKRDCERVADWLHTKGIEAYTYHSDLDRDERLDLEDRLLHNGLKALVATIALGMGFDKPDLGFVIHFQRPGSTVGYYQQIGRAGRNLERAYAILLNGREDDEIQEFFIHSAFPSIDEQSAVLHAIEVRGPISRNRLLPLINMNQPRLEKCLSFLELQGAVAHVDGRWLRTANPWKPDLEVGAAVSKVRLEELEEMKAYVLCESCLMEEIARRLDDPTAKRCGRCANDVGELVSSQVDAKLLLEAVSFLKRRAIPVQARKQWMGVPRRPFNIPRGQQCEDGLALCAWGDAGWGDLVRAGKHQADHFADDLVNGLVEMIKEWQPEPFPEWVTAVPSLRRRELVPDLAARLASALGLTYRAALIKVQETQPQKLMANGYQQATNVADAFEAAGSQVLGGPVFLVDDIVDSRWTMTECGARLRQAGSGPVYPVALASAESSGRSDW